MVARLDRPFVAVFPDQVRALGLESAVVLQFIAYSQDCSPEGVELTTQAIADGTGLTARTVQRVTTRLRDQGHLAAERASTWSSTLRWRVPVSAGQPESANVAAPRPREHVLSQTARVATSPSVSEGRELPPTSPPPEAQSQLPLLTVVPTVAEEPDHFARFWALYPRKVGKPKAEAAFAKAVRRASLEAIAAGLRAHLPAWEARVAAEGGDKQFIPHPTSWLNRDGWEDEPPPMPRAAQGSSWDEAERLLLERRAAR